MDDSFDTDNVRMAGANGNGNNQRGPITCHGCHQDGHKQSNCPQRQNNGGGNNRNDYNNQRAQGGRGGNANGNGNNQNNNGQRGQNGRGGQNNNNNAQRGQNGRGGNNNAQRGQNGRRGQNNGNNRNQNQNQNQQRAPQENRHGNPRRNYIAENNDRPEYCERCNKRDHTSVVCRAEAMGARCIMKCSLCKTLGHTHTVCRNPSYCANCWNFGHCKGECRRPHEAHTFFHTNEDIDLLDAESVCSSSDHSSRYSSPSQTRRSSVQTHFQVPQANNNGITKAYFANANGDLVLEAPLDEISAQIAAIAAEEENARRHAIAAKCCGAHAKYSMKLLNNEITSGARFLGGVDPADPQIQLPFGMERTAALERLFQFWINDNAFGKAAEFVRKGWNFFRDPRVLDAIARSSAPVCHCCKNKGHILSATFTELVPGTDVLTVEDYDLWGPSVMFSCQCSLDGYSFMRAEDGRMDIQFM